MLSFVLSFLFKEPIVNDRLLHSDYLVTYGVKAAKVHVIEYFSLSCHSCFEIFRIEFKEIKKRFIDTGKVYWIFCPYPHDFLTIQMMHCMEKMTEIKKRIFFEVVMGEVDGVDEVLLEMIAKAVGYRTNLQRVCGSRAFKAGFTFTQNVDLKFFPTFVIEGTGSIKKELVLHLKERNLL